MTAIIDRLRGSDNTVPMTVDETVEAIGNSRRRHVLVLLDDQDGEVSTGDLAEAIASIETGKEIPELTAQERKRVYIALYQSHLDTLDELGAIIFNSRSKEVRKTNATAGLVSLVRHLESQCERVE